MDMRTNFKQNPIARPGLRERKVSALLQEHIGSILRKLVPLETVGLVTVTDVRATPDLKEATVWISVFGGNAQQVMRTLKHSLPDIQSEVYHTLPMRPVPKLQFALDTSQADAAHLNDVIRSLHEHN